jgi:hypothetical protein
MLSLFLILLSFFFGGSSKCFFNTPRSRGLSLLGLLSLNCGGFAAGGVQVKVLKSLSRVDDHQLALDLAQRAPDCWDLVKLIFALRLAILVQP